MNKYKIFDIFKSEEDLFNVLDSVDVNEGSFSLVYSLFDDLVIKETDDNAYLRFIEVTSNLNSQHLPIVYDVQKIGVLYYVLMEKLEVSDLSFSLNHTAECAGYMEKDICVFKGVSESLDSILDILDNLKPDDVQWDLRELNVMQRSCGTLVITDPWFIES
jgi:hypothetical protein